LGFYLLGFLHIEIWGFFQHSSSSSSKYVFLFSTSITTMCNGGFETLDVCLVHFNTLLWKNW